MRSIRLEVDQASLLLICSALVWLDNIQVVRSNRLLMEERRKLGPRLFAHALSMPVPRHIKLSLMEAKLIDLAIVNYDCSKEEEVYARIISGQIQPKI